MEIDAKLASFFTPLWRLLHVSWHMSWQIRTFVVLFLRFSAAVIVAWSAWIGVCYSLGPLAIPFGLIGFYSLFILVGFTGVAGGTFCLPPSSRRWGSVFLLILGLAVYSLWWFRTSYDPYGFPHFWPLALGGLASVVLFLSKGSANNSLELTVPASRPR